VIMSRLSLPYRH